MSMKEGSAAQARSDDERPPGLSVARPGRLAARPLAVVGILSACVLLIALARLRTYGEPVRGDQGVYAVIGRELLTGRPLYADLWDHKPPAVHLTYALSELVVGAGPQQFYFLSIVALTITLLGLYRAGTLLGGPGAGLCAGVIWALGAAYRDWAGDSQPNTEVFCNAMLVWIYCLFFRLGTAPAWWRACALGAAVGVASLYKQTIIAPVALIALAYVFSPAGSGGSRWLRCRQFLVAGAVALLCWVSCAAWFFGHGQFADFYDAVFLYNRYYVGSSVSNLLGSLGPSRQKYLALVVVPCLLVPILSGGRLGRARRSGWLALAGWAAGTQVAIALPGFWFRHYYQIWMPVYALAGGALLGIVGSGLFETPRAWRRALLASVAFAFVLGPLTLRRTLNPYDTASPPSTADARDAGLTIDRALLPDETVYALGRAEGVAGLYLFSRRHPPSGIFWEIKLERGPLGPLADRLEERLVRDLDRAPPDLVVFDREPMPGLSGRLLERWVSPRYGQCPLNLPSRYVCYVRRGSALERRLAEVSEP